MTATSLSPTPGGARPTAMIVAHARFEVAQLLRNGEQLLLTAIIPTVLLVFFSQVDVVDLGPGTRVNYLMPGIIALAVMSTAFTSQAIGTGFERRYGVLKRLGTTPLGRGGLVAGKTAAVAAVQALQIALLLGVGAALGWRPHGSAWLASLALVALATVAFTGLALLMAGTLRAEATLAGANLLYLLLLLAGGIVIPLTKFPAAARTAAHWLPSTALADGMRAAMAGAGVPGRAWLVLAAWAVAAVSAAIGLFRWE
jgi:ABC-2 type transport system permease protein